MAEKFTRSWLTETLGLEPDVVKQIMARHVGVTDALKEQIADSDAQDEKLTKVQDELDKLKASHKETTDALKAAEKERDEIRGKYDTATADLDKMKSESAAKDDNARREAIIKEAGKSKKYSDEAVNIILDSRKDYAKMLEFDENGKATNIDAVFEQIASDRPSIVPKITETSHTPATPPANTGGKKAMTKDEIMGIRNTAERQQKIAENPALFGMPVNG